MMSLRRLFGIILLFLFFEAVVAVLSKLLLEDVNVLTSCAVMTGIAVAVWIVYMLVMRYMSRANTASPPAPAAAAEQAPPPVAVPAAVADDELAALIREANARLASAPVAAGQKVLPTVERLPLYLVVGMEGAGKTSTLFNSGLDVRLLAGESYRESSVLPTKLCNFWFASSAVFADVSGRVFSDDPDRWQNLLSSLSERQRAPLFTRIWRGDHRRSNLRGVVLLCDLNSFLRNGDPAKLAAEARRLQERLHAAGSVFGTDFPVYVMFSKADAVPYFGEFFGQLSETEDQRVLGATLPLGPSNSQGEVYAEAETRRLTGYFNRLYASLADKRLVLLARENVAGRKAFVYEFPRELKRTRSELIRFLVELFRPNPLQPGPKLRGFYFSGLRRVSRTSSLDEAPDEFSVVRSGADATVFFGSRPAGQTVHQSSGRPAASSTPVVERWAFVADLFRDVVLPDRATSPVATQGRFELFRNIGFGAIAALFLILVFLFLRSFSNNRTLLSDIRNSMKAAESIPEMEPIRTKLELLTRQERDGAPWKMRWGLYTGNDVLPSVHRLYFQRFKKLFLDPTRQALDNRFLQLTPNSPNASSGEVIDQVKAYRMMTSGACKPDKAVMDRLPLDLWLGGRAADDANIQVLAKRQIDFYTSELIQRNPYQNLAENDDAIKKAKDYLLSLKGPEPLLRSLLAQANQKTPGDDLSKYAANHKTVLTGEGKMEAGFTREGWDFIQKQIRDGNLASLGDTCVSGDNVAKATLQTAESMRDLQNLYVKEYIQHWKDFLVSEGVAKYNGLGDAVDKLRILSDNNRSPLLLLVYMISKNTNFGNADQKGLEDKVKQEAGNRLSRFFPGAGGKAAKKITEVASSQLTPALAPADISKAFQPAQATVSPASPDNVLNNANRDYVNSLKELTESLGPLIPRPGSTSDPSLIDPARKAYVKALKSADQLESSFNATGIDLDLKKLIEAPIRNVDSVLPRDSGQAMGNQANGAARKFCASFEPLRRKFPFDVSKTDEVRIDELTRIFAPVNGELWQLQQQPPFASVLVKQGPNWIQNQAAQPKLTPEFIRFFNSMARFSDLLFPPGSTQPKLEYAVQATSTSAINSLSVTIDGHKAPGSFTWPAAGSAAAGAKIEVKAGATIPLGSYQGVWGIFRMLQNADDHTGNAFIFDKTRQGQGTAEANLDLQSKPISVKIQIEMPGGTNVFDKYYFSSMRCVGRATQ